MNVLVAGGAGFIGSHIVDTLLEANANVTILDNMVSGFSDYVHSVSDRVDYINGDITNNKIVDSASKDKDVIIHVAFPASLCDLSLDNQFIETGVLGTYNLLRAAVKNDSKFVYGSSISVYGIQKETPINEEHPLDPIITYGATKLTGEVYCNSFQQEFGLEVVKLRYSDVYGPRFRRIGAPTAFILKGLKNEVLQINGDGKQTRDYVYVTDVAQGTVLAINDRTYGDVFNIASGTSYSIIDLAKTANEITGNDAGVEFVSNIDTQKFTANDIRRYAIDITKAKKILGFEPKINLREGLQQIKEWTFSSTS